MPTERPSKVRRPGCLAAACLLLPALGAWVVLAQGASADGQINAIGPAISVFLIWFLVPVSILFASRSKRLAWMIPLLVAVAAAAWTVWAIRPQAPDGHEHRETIEE